MAVPSWTCASSRTLKTDFLAVDGEDVLYRMRNTPVTTWAMTGGDRHVRHLGPVAEDFYRSFGLGIGETTIGLGDIDGVNFAGVKALEARTTALAGQLAEARGEVRAARGEIAVRDQRIAELEARLARLEALVAAQR